MDFAVPAHYGVKINESEKYLDLAIELKKTMKHEGNGDTNCGLVHLDYLQRIGKENEKVRNQKTSRDYPDSRIFEIVQNIEKSL